MCWRTGQEKTVGWNPSRRMVAAKYCFLGSHPDLDAGFLRSGDEEVALRPKSFGCGYFRTTAN